MKNSLLVIAILISISSNLISALPLPHFFFPNIPPGLLPNISSLPPGLLPNGTKSPWEAFQNFTGSHAGVKKEGLSKLKKYFQHFGYINNNSSSSSNFTDDFDDTLESAIKIYQRYFNLNVTGELDADTVEMIMRPRCGNEDIINGTSSMNSGKYSSSPSSSSHFHTTGHYSFFPNTPRWPENQYALTYAFLPANQLSETVKTVFSRAFTRWSQVTPLTFTVIDSYISADIRIGFFFGDHGDGEPFDGVLGTLAHAFSPTNGRLHLDAAESWVVEGITQSTTRTAIDLESVAIHEIGHLLGLGHSSIESAIMFPTIAAGTRKVDLSSNDIAGIQYLYGGNPNFNGSNTSSTSIQDTSNGGIGLLDSSFWRFMLLIAFGSFLIIFSL